MRSPAVDVISVNIDVIAIVDVSSVDFVSVCFVIVDFDPVDFVTVAVNIVGIVNLYKLLSMSKTPLSIL